MNVLWIFDHLCHSLSMMSESFKIFQVNLDVTSRVKLRHHRRISGPSGPVLFETKMGIKGHMGFARWRTLGNLHGFWCAFLSWDKMRHKEFDVTSWNKFGKIEILIGWKWLNDIQRAKGFSKAKEDTMNSRIRYDFNAKWKAQRWRNFPFRNLQPIQSPGAQHGNEEDKRK